MRQHSKFLLKKIMEEFTQSYGSGLPNQAYLEHNLDLLQKQAGFYETQSKNPQLPPRVRARNRDLMQNAIGLMKGIEFGIAFMLQTEENLDSLVEKSPSVKSNEHQE